MLKKLLILVVPMILNAFCALAQDGALKGKIQDKETGEAIPFANIIAERGGKLAGGTTSDFDGYYTIKPLPPGLYDLKVSFVGYKSIKMTGVIVTPDAITFQDLKMASTAEELDVVEVIGYEIPLISKDKTMSGETVSRDDIAAMPSRSVLGIAATVGGVFQAANGDINIRGARDNATNIYIDGVKVRGSSGIPQSAIDQVSVVTGGIPARYGDATGGIISITTRGPSDTYYGGVEYLSSLTTNISTSSSDATRHLGLDPYGYNLLGFNISGPLIKIWDKADSTKKPLLGFFLAGEFTNIKDPKPSAIGLYKVRDDSLASLITTPLRGTGTGTGSLENTEFIGMDGLEAIRVRENVRNKGMKLSGKFDVRTGPNINLTFGGNLDWNTYRDFSWGNSLFNYENNSQVINNTWRAYAKFTQKFSSPDESDEEQANAAIRNAFYTLHLDYSYFQKRVQGATHKDNFFDYGYVGKFTTNTVNSYEFGTDSITGYQGAMHNNFEDILYEFDGTESPNPDAAAYTQSYYDLYSDPIGNYENRNQVLDGGGLVNGYRPGELTSNVHDIWFSPGRNYNGYSNRNNNQFRILASGSADIKKNHEISAGFEYEQRTDRSYGVSPVALWKQMRLKANSHILQLDKANPQPWYFDVANTPTTTDDTIYGGVVDYPRLYDGASQTLFDYNLRQSLGLATNGLDWIDINAMDPSQFSLDMFSADELLNNGTSYVGYYGYDYKGNKLKSKPTLDDFFNQVSTVDGYNGPVIFDRPIGAYEPNYVAGYIQDKFAFKDLVFNIGVRIGRFDANQKVLKDPYLLFPAITAGEVRSGDDRANILADGQIPSSIGDDYMVYVDDVQNPGKILGYRDGDTWYNEEGSEIPNAKPLRTVSGVLPYLLDPKKTNAAQISSNAFEDYAPQTNFMPRIAFSFPISDEALFFAHYDVLTRRPSIGENPIERLSPTHYLYMQNRSITINNPNLKPSKTIDYELGFQQKLNSYSSLKISAFYREMRDQIQVTRITDAYPITYTTYGNLDFGTVKGMTFAYDLRRMGNVRVRASYTLAWANGTGSSATTALAVVNAGLPNLKAIEALNWDQRHQIQLTFDYHYGKGKDYDGPVWFNKKVFEQAGANFVVIGGSGTPYSKQRFVTREGSLSDQSSVLLGTLNGSRLPWQVRIDGRIDKYFDLEWGKEDKKRASLSVYLQLLNILNTLNISSVYRSTGNPDDDGHLASLDVSNIDQYPYGALYAVKVNNPGNYGLPRRIRLGLLLNF
ncbi:MAG TPA: hypothetical protein EYN71_07910 [Flavobacteriales bacterium]|nr:hypothetical protein [Flavobacteriales bacterium]HIO68110.1 hypothetical protein [Flavobacteriales bacterium]